MSTAFILRGGTLIDGDGNPPRANPGIHIHDGRIVALGDVDGELAAQPLWQAAEVIDAEGKYITPGLIDGHCHISLHQGRLPGLNFTSNPEYCTLWAARNVAQTLAAGVTGISVPGGKWLVDVTVRDAVRGGLLQGPRMFCAARGLTPYGGIFDMDPAWEEDTNSSPGVICNTIDEYLVEVRRQCKHGVDLIKIADSYWGDTQTIALEEMKAVVDEAHRRNVLVTIHSRGGSSTRDAAVAGVDWIMHADFATDEDLDIVAARGVPIMPTFTSQWLVAHHGGEMGFSMAARDRIKVQLETNYRAIEGAIKRGIRIMAGTDSGNMGAYGHGKWHGYEAEILVNELGMEPLKAISAITRDSALSVGLEGQVGVVAKGYLADLVVWSHNPVDDISTLRRTERIVDVYLGGKRIDRNHTGFLQLPTEPPRSNSR